MSSAHFSIKQCLVMTFTIGSVIFLLIFLFHSMSASPTPEQKANLSTLQLVHIVFRHGPRTPADTYPNDPHVNETFAPFGWGHITNNGKRELFNIGSWLRKRYDGFFTPHYHPDLVHAQATGVTRTHMSMQTVLASFFPPKGTDMEWNSKYNWQPIPVFSQELDEDTLLLVRKPCPRYHEAFEEVMQLPEVQHEIAPYKEMFKELTEITGLNITSPEDVQSIYLTLLAEQEYGLELPEWTKAYFPDRMQFLTEQSYVYNVYTPEMQKIKAGPFLQKMLKEMQEKRDGQLKPEKRKLFIYTGHDSTVVNVLSALRVWERQLPRYSVMAIFELHKNPETDEHYVEIYFRNNPNAPAEQLIIPGCESQCSLDELIEFTRNVTAEDTTDARCSSKVEGFTEPPLRGP